METIIKVNGIGKSYKKRKSNEVIHAVKHVSFDVNRGEIVGLLGPNGAGKTTTIKMICGLLKPDCGEILINGIDNHKHRLKALNHISAVLEGNRNLYWRLTVRENLEYFAGNRGQSRKEVAELIDQLLVRFHLEHKEHELVNRLSRGMQQKLAIAVAMMAETEVLMLDEPTLGLDVEMSHEVREILKQVAQEDSRTIIISSHDMGVIQDVCERTIIVNDGEIITDSTIDDLMKLFDVRSYKITLGDKLTEKQEKLLKTKFSAFEYDNQRLEPLLKIELYKTGHIYQLFDILRINETPVESIDREIIPFEQVFMKIVKGEKTNETAQSI